MRHPSPKLVLYGGLLLAGVLTPIIAYLFRNPSAPPDGRLHIRYRITIQNTTNRPILGTELQVGVPLKNTSTQSRIEINADHPFTVIPRDNPQQSLLFKWDKIPPYTTKVVSIQSALEIWHKARPQENNQLGDFLKPEHFIESDNADILALAHQLQAGDVLKTARTIFNWVAANISYNGYIRRTRGAAYAYKYHQGDCTEYAYLFVALCRANGIPARPVAGFVCSQSAVLDLGDYHNWAEFYADGRWRIADPQRKIFLPDPAAYIAFRIIRPSIDGDGNLVSGIKGTGLRVRLNS